MSEPGYRRAGDLALLVALMPVAVPLILLLCLANLAVFGRPIFFSQPRGGRGGKPFQIYKLRSMLDLRGASGALLPDHQRLTRYGRFLRAASLDELPCLWNVARGDIGFVGPRPLMAQYLPLYSTHQMRRHDVRPGITGWAQVNGRNSLSWPEKFELDIWYVEHRTIWLDFRILWLTAIKVVRREGISAENEATMSVFKGNDGA